eukprot:7288383-Prymnesium_polylepis.1
MAYDASAAAPLLEVRGVRVTADHAVRCGDGAWRRVREVAVGPPCEQNELAEPLLFDLITSDHRVPVVGANGEATLFADYEETDDTAADLSGFLLQLEREDREMERECGVAMSA